MMKNKRFLPAPHPGGTRRPPGGPRPPKTGSGSRKPYRRSKPIWMDDGYTWKQFGKDVLKYYKWLFNEYGQDAIRASRGSGYKRMFLDKFLEKMFEEANNTTPWVRPYARQGTAFMPYPGNWHECNQCVTSPVGVMFYSNPQCSLNQCGDVLVALPHPVGTSLPDFTRRIAYLERAPGEPVPNAHYWGREFYSDVTVPAGSVYPVPGYVSPLPDAEPEEAMPLALPEKAVEQSPAIRTLISLIDAMKPVQWPGYGRVVLSPDGHYVDQPSVQPAVAVPGADLVPSPDGNVIIVTPGGEGPPRIIDHGHVPDRKNKGGGKLGAVLAAYHAMTEVVDGVDVLADAIPGKPCKSLPGVRKAACVWEHLSEIDWSKAVPGLIYNQLEDRAVAAIHVKLGGLKEFGGPNVVQMTQFQRQLKTYGADPLSIVKKPGRGEQAIKEFLNAELPAYSGMKARDMYSY